MKKILIFSSGTKDGGGSGFKNLVEKIRDKDLDCEVIGVIGSHENGGVRKHADDLEVPFVFMEKPYTAEKYKEIVSKFNPDIVALSGWLKLVTGLDPQKTINIHPGPLPRFGGAGMYGHFVHEALMQAFKDGEVTHSAVTMHFVTEKYDEGPVFFVCKVPILPDDTAETLAKRVNEAEHKWQPEITARVARGEIGWDGKNPSTIFGNTETDFV